MKFEKIAEEFFINASEKFQEYAEWSGMGMNGVFSFKEYDDMLTDCSIDFKKQEFLLSWIYDYSDAPGCQSKTAYTLAFPFSILDMDEDKIHQFAQTNKIKKEELDRLNYLANKLGYELKEII